MTALASTIQTSPASEPDGGKPSDATTSAGGHSDFSSAHRLMRRLGNRWTFPILGALRLGPMRFAKLKRALDPVSQRMLTLSLRKLERDSLIYREELPGQPVQVAYGLTPLGTALVARLEEFENWLVSQGKIPAPPQS